MERTNGQLKVGLVCAGMAGSACAQALMQAGHVVQVFDKSRGPGGRMATRLMPWVDDAGVGHLERVDHGVPGFVASGLAFRSFVSAAERAGQLLPWRPVVDPAGWPLDDGNLRHVAVPDMPQLCRSMLNGSGAHWHRQVQGLSASADGWRLVVDGQFHPALFDAVILALPPAQTAALLGPHCREWVQRASLAVMQPCWTLMGVADEFGAGRTSWQMARPTRGPLGCLVRADASPGRQYKPHQQAWVAHARPSWSREHLEQPADWVQAQLQAAVADWLGCSLTWRCAKVHRWRYAMPGPVPAPRASQCWWNARMGIGVCGDFLGGQGGNGVEGAWLSGTELARSFLADKGHFTRTNDHPATQRSASFDRFEAKAAPVS
jgi:renalase